jgi:hypothetical protein
MNSSRSISLTALPRQLYTHNPFYLISALLVLYGSYRSLPPDSSAGGGWLLLGLLCGYTLALALAGYVIIRFGQVWDDARTILLTLVLLFVALSAGFDRIVLDDPLIGARLLLLGLLFVALISEGVLQSLKIRLAGRYRGPYYLLLTLMFCYPVLLGQLSKAGQEDKMPLFVFLFPVVAGLAFLTLLPAARARNKRKPQHDVPWSWPGYPWSLFIVLLIATALRSYSFSLGFESGHAGQSSFQPFFLLPLSFASAILVLELGIAAQSRPTCAAALIVPLGLLLLAMPGEAPNPVATRFLATFSNTVGSPAQWTVGGLAVFYVIAWIRGLRLGEIGLIICITVLAFVDEQTTSPATLTSPHWLPLAFVALSELILGIWLRTSWRQMLGVWFGMATLSCLGWDRSLLPQSNFCQWPLPVLAVLLLGAACDDRWARLMRRFAWPLIPLVGMFAVWEGATFQPEAPRWVQAFYLVCLTALSLAYWYRAPAVRRFVAAAIMLLVLTGANARWLYLGMEESQLAAGLPWLAWGSASLAFALLVSFAKGGLVTGLFHWLRSFGDEARPLGQEHWTSAPSIK